MNYWRKRTKFEKRLYILSLILSLVIVGLIISICIISVRKVDSTSENTTCQSNVCKQRGKELKSSINNSVDPCDDFYAHCCGGWLQQNPLPPNTEIYGRFEKHQIKLDEDIRELLTEKIKNKKSRSMNQMKIFYDACLDTERIEARGTTPLLNFLEELRGWPLLSNDWNNTGYDWIEAISTLVRRTATGYIIRFIVSPDTKNTSNRIIQLDRPHLLIKTNLLLNSNETTNAASLDELKERIKKIASFLNASNDDLESDIEGIIDLERNMAKMMVPVEEYSRNIYNKATVQEFHMDLPKLDLLRYLQLVTNETLKTTGKPISGEDTIIIKDMAYLQNLMSFITDQPYIQRQIANYLGWRVIEKYNNHFPAELTKIMKANSTSASERRKFCVSLTQVSMGYAVAHAYITEKDWSVYKNDVTEMVHNEKTIFKEILQDTEWMDNNTKKEALRKIEVMKGQIGYPDWLLSEENLDEFYKSMGDVGPDPFTNDLTIAEYTCGKLIMQLRQTPKFEEWTMTPLQVNALYTLTENSITVPVAILQSPFYDISLPRYVNYATIGFIIGHEITHGFDNQGSQRDELGNEVNWWTSSSKEEFNRRANCFVQQYNSYGINGEWKLAENIADNGGIKQAYLGYKMWQEEQRSRPQLLPGFENYTADQLFFLSYCSLWCTQYSEYGWNVSVSALTHSPLPYRVWGAISNMKGFSEAFQCDSSKKMNRENKCGIW